ncbi:Vitamin B12 import ATP-binding protein BtuD [Pseudomonas aeruginosa]
MDGLRLRFRRAYPGFELDIDLALPGRGVTALFGHSGSGKSTCLRCIAGLEKAAEGEVTINGETWQDSRRNLFVAPHRRALGYVFQDANLFRHLTVRRNLAFGLKRIAAAERRVELEQACALLGIEHLLERMPERLSGGEQQRVGIARALLTSPRLLLMDEPLASLDLKRKGEILPYLERLHEELDIPVLMSATRQTKWRAWPITWCCWRTARSAPAGRSAKPWRESTCRWRWTTTPGW